jgi:hypothetical protein
MTAMFPGSGVPAADARNSLPDPDTVNCDELWYSTSRCQPRFDPAAANAVLAELINLINKGEVSYDCDFLNNVETAVRYLIQRGLPIHAPATGGPADYLLDLDPDATRYNDGMTLMVVPNVNNNGPVRVNANGLGLVPVLRNDGTAMLLDDWRANRPSQISYWQGSFYLVSLSQAQVSKTLGAPLDLWVNNAIGLDTNDGTANDAAHALATIQKAVDLAFSYLPGPYPINIHVMNGSGNYAQATMPVHAGPHLNLVGESMTLTRIHTLGYWCFLGRGPNSFTVSNFKVTGVAAPAGLGGLIAAASGASGEAWNITVEDSGQAGFLSGNNGSLHVHDVTFAGNMYACFYTSYGGSMSFAGSFNVLSALNVSLAVAFSSGNGSMAVPGGTAAWGGGGLVVGAKYNCLLNGIINDQVGSAGAPWFPGSIAGSLTTGGQYL